MSGAGDEVVRWHVDTLGGENILGEPRVSERDVVWMFLVDDAVCLTEAVLSSVSWVWFA